MRLKRRFDWMDRTTIYKRVNEDEVERVSKGMIRFTACAIDGRLYEGAAFEPTVSDMTIHDYWRLDANPKKPEKSIVVEAGPNLTTSVGTSEKGSETAPDTSDATPIKAKPKRS